jgi:hypothetical protein
MRLPNENRGTAAGLYRRKIMSGGAVAAFLKIRAKRQIFDMWQD